MLGRVGGGPRGFSREGNIAGLYESGPVPNAGLQLLRAHDSEWNAADPGYPFETRARLERLINDESEEFQALYRRGEQLFKQLTDFSTRALASPDQRALPPTLNIDATLFKLEDPGPPMAHYSTATKNADDKASSEHEFVFGVPFFPNVFLTRKRAPGLYILRADQSGLDGIRVDLQSAEARPVETVIAAG